MNIYVGPTCLHKLWEHSGNLIANCCKGACDGGEG